MAQSLKTHQERKTTSPGSGQGGGRVLPFKTDMPDREAFGEAMQMQREAQNPHMKAGAIPQRMNTLARKGEQELPEQELASTNDGSGKQIVSATLPPVTPNAHPLDTSGGGGNAPGGSPGHVRTDVASIQAYSRSKNVGQELGSNPDAHLGYQRIVEIDAEDGRRITIRVQGRTTLDALHSGQSPSLDAQGPSQVLVQVEVVGDYGRKNVIQADASGIDGDATMRSLIMQVAAEQGIPPSLLLPGTADDGYVGHALALADRVQPVMQRPPMEPTEHLEEADPTIEQPQLKDWETMTEEERRAEVWETFKAEFSWEEVVAVIAVGAALMWGMSASPLLGLIVGTLLSEAAIIYGVADLVGQLTDDLPMELGRVVKDALMVIGGALALVSIFALLAQSTQLAAAAGFAALMAAIGYVVTEAILAHFHYQEAVAAHSREEMQRLAKDSAKDTQGAVADGILTLPALKSLPTLLKEMATPTMSAPGEEALPSVSEGEAKSQLEETAVLPAQVGSTSKNPLGLPAIKRIKLKFKLNGKHDPAEFSRQMQGQEDGLNRLTVEEYLTNRDRYLKEGRAPEGSRAQRDFRDQALKDRAFDLMSEDPSLSHDDAMAQAQEWMDGQAALHDPDQVAGGHPDRITGLGDKGVNSSLGSQWSKKEGLLFGIARAKALDAHIRGISQGMTPQQRSSTYLNVKLEQ